MARSEATATRDPRPDSTRCAHWVDTHAVHGHRPQDQPDGAPALAALLGRHSQSAHGKALASALDAALDACLVGGDRRPLDAALVRAVVTCGAEGAELWRAEAARGWRRLAGAGQAVRDAESVVTRAAEARRSASDAYPGSVAATRSLNLCLVFTAGQPGTDEREELEDVAEALLALVATCDVPGCTDDDGCGPPSPASGARLPRE